MKTRIKLRAAVIAALAVTAALCVAVPSADATFPNHNGRIAFRQYLNEEHTWGAVFTLKPNGTGERQVTFPPASYVDQTRTVTRRATDRVRSHFNAVRGTVHRRGLRRRCWARMTPLISFTGGARERPICTIR
jgi:hypothetical protein